MPLCRRGFPHTNKRCSDTSWVSYNLLQWGSHELRARTYKTVPAPPRPTNFSGSCKARLSPVVSG